MLRAHRQPRALSPADLEPLRALVGDGALDYALVLGSFHFVNRIADQLGVDPELLPSSLRRLEPLRRLSVRVAALGMRRMLDLAPRSYAPSYAEALAELTPVFEKLFGRPPGDDFAPLATRPKIVEALRLMLEERALRCGLAPEVLTRVEATVESALPSGPADLEALHARPPDPVEAFAFVGTRYPQRTTGGMVEALRDAGYGDRAILDLAIAVADANQWARLQRLCGLPPTIGETDGSRGRPDPAPDPRR